MILQHSSGSTKWKNWVRPCDTTPRTSYVMLGVGQSPMTRLGYRWHGNSKVDIRQLRFIKLKIGPRETLFWCDNKLQLCKARDFVRLETVSVVRTQREDTDVMQVGQYTDRRHSTVLSESGRRKCQPLQEYPQPRLALYRDYTAFWWHMRAIPCFSATDIGARSNATQMWACRINPADLHLIN